MKKRKISRIGAVAMATVLTVQGMGIPTAVLAADKPAVMSSDSDTQMSSEKENVYVNQYGRQQSGLRTSMIIGGFI